MSLYQENETGEDGNKFENSSSIQFNTSDKTEDENVSLIEKNETINNDQNNQDNEKNEVIDDNNVKIEPEKEIDLEPPRSKKGLIFQYFTLILGPALATPFFFDILQPGNPNVN